MKNTSNYQYLHLFLLTMTFFWVCSAAVLAQNQGTQTFFGKNRVQYEKFDWQYYRTAKYDVFFYAGGRELAVYTAKSAEKISQEIESFLNYKPTGRYQFMVYKSVADEQQSNLGLGDEQFNTGGITKIVGNKIMLNFDGNRQQYEQNIRKGIAKVIVSEMLYGGSTTERIQNATLIYLPEWYLNGFFSYIESPWNTAKDNRMRDLFLMGKYKRFSHFLSLDETMAGASFWYFLGEKYGKNALANVVYLTKVNRDYESALQYVLGKNTRILTAEWYDFFAQRYNANDAERTLPAKEFQFKKFRKGTRINQIKYNAKGDQMLYVSHYEGINKLWLFDAITQTHTLLHRSGLRYANHDNPNQYPIATWHPTGKQIAFLYEKKSEIQFGTLKFNNKTQKPDLNEFPLLRFDDAGAIDYSPDGQNIIVSASVKGQSDIFVFNVPSKSIKPITNDHFDDAQAQFVFGGTHIAFVSNRTIDSLNAPISDTTQALPTSDVFLYHYSAENPQLLRVTNTPITNETAPIAINKTYFAFLSDENGIYNRYFCEIDSIYTGKLDTTTTTDPQTLQKNIVIKPIYKDTAYYQVASNMARNIEWNVFNPKNKVFLDLMLYKNKLKINLSRLPKDSLLVDESNATTPEKTPFRIAQELKLIQDLKTNKIKLSDVIFISTQKQTPTNDSIAQTETPKIDTLPQHYTFQIQTDFMPLDSLTAAEGIDKIEQPKDQKDQFRTAKTRYYSTSFSADYFITQVGASLMPNNLPTFLISNATNLTQRPGIVAMASTSDLFENTKFSGGVRISTDLRNNAFFLMYQNLNKRLDKKLVFHQQRQTDFVDNDVIRTTTYELMAGVVYPINPQLSIHWNNIYRHDRFELLSTDLARLKTKGISNNWLGTRVELVKDNTTVKQLNILYGTRWKIFAETYASLNNRTQMGAIVGFDVRNYTKIHKNIIWANRLVANASIGREKILYLMGGVDNWLLPKYNSELAIPANQNFAFRALATNMRGFFQNARNGSNYAVWNSELRLPIVSYLSKSPLSSDFLRNFQVVGFVDVGTAWSGLNPFSQENPFNTQIFERGPVSVTVFSNKNPILVGYGTGLRTRLFGYFIRGDVAWGIDDNYTNKPVYYLSLSLDF